MAAATTKSVDQMSADELRQALAAAQRELSKNAKAFSFEFGDYNGAATVAFEGSFKPWRKGWKAIKTVLDNGDALRAAAKKLGID